MAKKVKLIAKIPLLRFGLPQSEGQTLELDKNQADELIDLGYAEVYTGEVKDEAPASDDTSTDKAEA